MSIGSILLRVLLSVSLILNGVTTAAAATHMHAAQTDKQAALAEQSTAAQVVAEEMPCHGHHQATATHDESAVAVDPAPGKSKHPSPDCCKSNSCSCAC